MIERAKKSLSGVLTWWRALPASVWVLSLAAIVGALSSVLMTAMVGAYLRNDKPMPIPSEIEG
jgi:hypothetical protein